MVKVAAILGKNARSKLFSYSYNSSHGRKIASSKLLTKKALRRHDVPCPVTFAVFKKPKDIESFDWDGLPTAFALKPSRGLGGEGIVVVKKRAEEGGWLTTGREKVTKEDLKLHVLDILEGSFSMGSVADRAYIEEFVGRHKAFRKFAYRGTPDIRIIVFNKVPVMAMLRLPTKESGGRANLHQGAIAVGVDIATGITTRAFWHGSYLTHKPGTKRKLNGIKIPKWKTILEIAVRAGQAAGLGYMGADVVLHPEKGPMVLEVNYQPGLQIQIANRAGLKKRLERVDDLEVRDAEHGVKIAKALFASSFADRVKAEEGIRTIGVFEEIKIKVGKKKKKAVMAKIDTGAWRTSVSEVLAKDLGLLKEENILWTKRVRSSMGTDVRPVIGFTFWLAGRKIQTPASVAKRASLNFPVIIGRKSLKGFLVDPHVVGIEKQRKVE